MGWYTSIYFQIGDQQYIQAQMGQKCCAEIPQKQYYRTTPQDKLNLNLQLKSTPATESTQIPQGLQTVPLPTLTKQVHEVYENVTPYNPKPTNRLRGVVGDPKLLNAEGTVYAGEWKDCMPHGKGVMHFADGSVYEGIFNEGTPDREGRLINNNGVYYEGEISNGEAFGEGRLVNRYRNYTYDGNWAKDIPQGLGKQKWGNDIYYEGNFVQGKKEGNGKYVDKDNFQYNGVFQNDQINHNGKVLFYGGDTYEGMLKKGLMNGYGIYTWKNGSQYEGHFLNGKKNGKGKYMDANGTVFDGMWRDGKRHGKGTLKVPGLNDLLHWEWKNDFPVQAK